MKSKILRWFLLFFLALPLAATAGTGDGGSPVRTFVSILPQAYFVKRIGGERVAVSVMVKPGQSPATYAPSPRQISALSKADIYFSIGVPFERGFMDRVSETLSDLKVVDTRQGIPLRKMAVHHHDDEPHGEGGHGESANPDHRDIRGKHVEHGGDHAGHVEKHAGHDGDHAGHVEEHAGHDGDHAGHAEEHVGHDGEHAAHGEKKHADHDGDHAEHGVNHEEHAGEHKGHDGVEHAGAAHSGHRGERPEEHGDHHEGTDPHTWLSPLLAKRQAAVIRDALMAERPGEKALFQAGYERLAADLDALHERIAKVLKPLKGRDLYVFHPAYGYFADAYGLNQVAIEMAGKSPDARTISRFIQRAKESGVRVVFVQPQFSARSAETIAGAIGGAVISLDPLAEDYIANLTIMTERIERALGRNE